MPELPEVETVVRGLKKLIGQKILRVFVLQPQTVSGKGNLRRSSTRKTEEFSSELQNEIFKSVKRRGKNIVFETKSGKLILAHLKMTGQFIYERRPKSGELRGIEINPDKHTRVIFELSGGNLFFNDIRRFGYLLYFPNRSSLAESGHFSNLGLEPFDPNFNQAYLRKNFSFRKTSLKSALMSQNIVAGLGNIYVDEVCFKSKISPLRPVNSLSDSEIKKLRYSILSILKNAIRYKGSSTKNYRTVSGDSGKFASLHQVYGRAGKACLACAKPLKKTIIGSRTTVFCVNCQN